MTPKCFYVHLQKEGTGNDEAVKTFEPCQRLCPINEEHEGIHHPNNYRSEQYAIIGFRLFVKFRTPRRIANYRIKTGTFPWRSIIIEKDFREFQFPMKEP